MSDTVKITTTFHGHMAHIGFGPINNPIEADAAIVNMLKLQGYPINIVADAEAELESKQAQLEVVPADPEKLPETTAGAIDEITKAEVKLEVIAEEETKVEAEPEAQPEAELEVKAEIEPEVKAEAEVEAEPEIKVEAKVEAEPEVKVEEKKEEPVAPVAAPKAAEPKVAVKPASTQPVAKSAQQTSTKK